MPVVSDFTTIRGNGSDGSSTFTVGPGSWKAEFDTGGRHAPGTAYIAFELRDMEQNTQKAEVTLNGDRIGFLTGWGGSPDQWATQIISVPGSSLNNGNNLIAVGPVANQPFRLRNVICHFHQDTRKLASGGPKGHPR